jgi:hypothetical protein
MSTTLKDAPVTLEVSAPDREPPDDTERSYMLLGLSRPMNARLEELAARGRVSKAEILNRAVGLYKALSDAILDGKRVGIVDDPEIELESEFVGF